MSTLSTGIMALITLSMVLEPVVVHAEEPLGGAAEWSDLSLLELMGVEVVSASRSGQSLAEAPAVIDVLTAEQLRQRGYRTVGEALQSLPGLYARHDHLQYDLGVRGIPGGIRSWSRTVKVMVDSQPVSFRPSGENFLGVELIPLNVVDRIEILRGPASVMYGANAFLGVVNIITRHGYLVYGDAIEAGYEGGANQQTPWVRGGVGHTFGDLEVLAGFEGETRTLDGYRLVTLPDRPHQLANEETQTGHFPSGSAYARLSYEGAHFGLLTLDGVYQRLDRSAEFADWGVMSHETRYQLDNGYARLSYQKALLEELTVQISASLAGGAPGADDKLVVAPDQDAYVRRELGYRGYDLGAFASYSGAYRTNAVLGVDASLEDQEVLTYFTVSGPNNEIRNPPTTTPTGYRDFRTIGVYGQGTIYPFAFWGPGALSELSLTAGGRLDAHNIYGNDLNGRAGIVYTIAGKHYAKLLWGSAYRAPSSTQLFANYIAPQGTIGNPDLRPERAQTVELALGATPLRDATLRLSSFMTRIHDRVEIQDPLVSVAIANAFPQNSTPINSLGFEFQADYQGPELAAFLNVSLQRSRYEKLNTLSLQRESVSVDTDLFPTFLFKGGITWTLPDYFVRTHLEGRYVGATKGHIKNNALVHGLDFLTEQYSLSPHWLVDVTVSSVGLEAWAGHETTLSAKVRNVVGTSYALPGTAGFDIPGFARTFEVSLRQEL